MLRKKNCESCDKPHFCLYALPCGEKFIWKCIKCGFGRIFSYLTIDDELANTTIPTQAGKPAYR